MLLLIGVEDGHVRRGHHRTFKVWKSNVIVTITPCSYARLVAWA